MKIFGIEIKFPNRIAEERDKNPFGKVVFNIQIRERGITLADPDGVKTPTFNEVNPRAWLLGHTKAEQFNSEWVEISKMPDHEVINWMKLGNENIANGVPLPTGRALEEVIANRSDVVTKENDGSMFQ